MKKAVIGLMLVACAISACQEKDLYDPTYNPNLGARVPDNFEWSTTKTLNVNVEVNDEYDGKYYYAVRVYDKKPGEGILPVAASGKANKDFPFSQKIVIPATVTKLYIVQAFKNADASEVITEKELAVSGENLACSFGNGSATRSVSTRDKNEDKTELTENTIIEKQRNYYLNGTYTIGAIDSKIKDVAITVNAGGTLNFSETVTLPNQWNIDVEYGGKLTANDNTTISFENNSALNNYGEVRIYDIVFNNGSTLYNGDAMEGKNEGGCFYAHNITLNHGNGIGSDKRTLGERSYTSCNQLTLNNVKLKFKTSAWLNCNVLLANGGACTLYGDDSTIGDTKYVGLATIGTKPSDDDINIENILVVNNIEGAIGKIQIVGTTCNEGGLGNFEKAKLGEYTYIFEDMYPEQGDYDMNDIVISLTATTSDDDDDDDDDSNDENRKRDNDDDDYLIIKGELKAVGASLAIVPYIKVGEKKEPLFSDGNDGGKEAHTVLTESNMEILSPINTITGEQSFPAQKFELKFEIDDDDDDEKLTMNDIDLYIMVDGQEIHWNTMKDKATWGMRVPGLNFKWAREKVKITTAYPTFIKWFENKSYDWYNNPKSELIY